MFIDEKTVRRRLKEFLTRNDNKFKKCESTTQKLKKNICRLNKVESQKKFKRDNR